VQAIVDGERVAEGAYAMAMDDLRQSNYIDLAERAVALLGRQIGELLRATTPAELEFRVGEARRAREAKVDELAALRDRVADAEHARAVAVATLSEQLDAANARVAELESVNGYVSDILSDASTANETLKARVATLEAECVATRRCFALSPDSTYQRTYSELETLVIAARAATGPIGGVA
jgi:multidrug efflux pump subunit AcrA (membrane-fusion protein)